MLNSPRRLSEICLALPPRALGPRHIARLKTGGIAPMPDIGKSDSTPRLVIHQSISSNDQNGFAKDVRAGLTATPKTLKPKYLYDALGSLLFEAICHLPEYYLTRASRLCYQPIDISETILEQSAKQLLEDYQGLRITAHAADYTRGISSIARKDGEKVLALLLGSNIGNYMPDEARELLSQIRNALRPGDGL